MQFVVLFANQSTAFNNSVTSVVMQLGSWVSWAVLSFSLVTFVELLQALSAIQNSSNQRLPALTESCCSQGFLDLFLKRVTIQKHTPSSMSDSVAVGLNVHM